MVPGTIYSHPWNDVGLSATGSIRTRLDSVVFQGIRPLRRAQVSTDVIAGVTLACLAIPEVMGYTKIAGMPVITGLYTILIPILVFAVLGSSRHLVVGADSATAAIMAAGLAGLAIPSSPQYVALAGLLALMTGAFLVIARIVRLGFLANFLSRSVLIGFLTGVGIQIACGQVAGVLGVPSGTGGTLQKLWGTLGNASDTSRDTLLVAIGVIVVIVGARRVNRRIPGALIAVVGSIVISWGADLAAHGVAVLGPVPSGLPHVGVPHGGLHHSGQLAVIAASMFVVVLAQSAATSRAYAGRYGEQFSENVDLVGLGAANLSAGLSGAFVVNGSPTKTQMVDSAGGRSQLCGITTGAVVLVVLLFLTKPLEYLPEATLSAVVLLIGLELIDLAGMRRVLRLRRGEFAIAAITAVIVVVSGVEQGIISAMILSIIPHLRRTYVPRNTVLASVADQRWIPAPRSEPAPEPVPGMIVYRFEAGLYYANADGFAAQIRSLVANADPPITTFCIDASAIDDIDYSAAETLLELCREARMRRRRIAMCEVADPVLAELRAFGIAALIGEDRIFHTLEDAIAMHRAAPPPI
jgi:high affinity sulfate transporter 1